MRLRAVRGATQRVRGGHVTRRAAIACTLLSLLATGCEPRAVIDGTVTNVQGEGLPGVAVMADAAGQQVTTNALGQYSLPLPPGTWTIDFAKTGYAPAQREVADLTRGTTQVDPIALWHLPISAGVYFFEDYRYQPLDRRDVKRYVTAEGGDTLFAITQPPERITLSRLPRLLCYRLFSYDLAVHRLEQTEAVPARAAGSGQVWNVWAPVERIPALPGTVDQPRELLLRVDVGAPLEPGVYAVHWGALEGHTSTHPRVYVFEVVEALPAAEGDGAGNTEGEGTT